MSGRRPNKKEDAGNADIRGFFKPRVASSTTTTPQGSQISLPGPKPSSPLPFSPVPAEPGPEHKPADVTEGRFDRNRVFDASDDDEDDGSSDASFEDLATLLAPRKPSAAASGSCTGSGSGLGPGQAPAPKLRDADSCVTPKAKRTALASFHASPLASRPKHKFDLKALISHAMKDDATEASSRRVASLEDQERKELAAAAAVAAGMSKSGRRRPGGQEDEGSAEESGDGFVRFVAADGEEGHMSKVLKAVERTEATASRMRWYFFDVRSEPPPAVKARPFPMSAANGAWKFLADGRSRDEHVASGLPAAILSRTTKLPDDLFLWMLHEAYLAESSHLRKAYVKLVDLCPKQVKSQVTPELLQSVFEKLGATGEARTADLTDRLRMVSEVPDAYPGRDWSRLQAVFTLLSTIGNSMDIAAVTYAVKILLRMAADRMVPDNIDILMDHSYTITNLVEAVPSLNWDEFCEAVTTSMHSAFQEPSLRVSPLLCMSTETLALHELRQRMSIAFFFDSPPLAGRPPRETFTMRRVMDRLKDDRFRIGPDTDYVRLTAEMHLLNLAVDDGVQIPGSASAASSTADEAGVDGVDGADPVAEKQFNDEVDELVVRLKTIWGLVNDSGMSYMSRTEAKSVLEWVQERLTYTVRTKSRPKKSIFDLPTQRDDPFLPRQQDYMRKFIRKERSVGGVGATGEDA